MTPLAGRYRNWYPEVMPGLSITFTEQELDHVRAAAGRDAVSLKAYVHDTTVAAARADRIADIAASVAARSKALNARLAR